MRTGEGKTLVAVLPAYLNALTGKGVHVVTVSVRENLSLRPPFGSAGAPTLMMSPSRDECK